MSELIACDRIKCYVLSLWNEFDGTMSWFCVWKCGVNCGIETALPFASMRIELISALRHTLHPRPGYVSNTYIPFVYRGSRVAETVIRSVQWQNSCISLTLACTTTFVWIDWLIWNAIYRIYVVCTSINAHHLPAALAGIVAQLV